LAAAVHKDLCNAGIGHGLPHSKYIFLMYISIQREARMDTGVSSTFPGTASLLRDLEFRPEQVRAALDTVEKEIGKSVLLPRPHRTSVLDDLERLARDQVLIPIV
ncbi:MAG: hypothetical protein ACREA0_06110, partial [bacterium]